MSRYAGKTGEVKIAPHGGTLAAIVGVKSWEIDAKCDAVDVTGMDSGGAKEFLSGLTEWNGTVECFVDSSELQILDEIREGVPCDVAFAVQTGGLTFSGTGVITGIKPSVSVEGAVTLSLTIQGSGGLEIS